MAELRDLFGFENGGRVRSRADWGRRRAELSALLLDIEYGPLPAAGARTMGRLLHAHQVARFGDARHEQYKLTIEGNGPPSSFLLDVLIPRAAGATPVILSGDGCWRYLSDAITIDVLRRGYVLAEFSRVEIVPDTPAASGSCRVHGQELAALAAWAWGYHRCIDFLVTCAFVDPTRIAVVGHSRGGKTTLLAGATDDRIALVGANGSGCGGAGCHLRRGPGSESLDDILRRFPYWFSPALRRFAGKEESLPFDQHYLKALIAPRPLITTEALGDLWANPTGTWHTHAAAREAYRFLGVPERIGISYREGGHEHSAADWFAFLDFTDWHLRALPPARRFDANPFPDEPPAFSWSAPRNKASAPAPTKPQPKA